MNAAEIRSALLALRAASAGLRERPARELLDVLGTVLERWRDPHSEPRERLAKELPEATGFSESVVREGMARALAGWSREALLALVERELGGIEALDGPQRGARAGAASDGPDTRRTVTGFPTAALLLAGSLPSPTLLDVLAPLVLRSAVLIKPASRDPVTACVVAGSIRDVDAELGACVAVTPFASDDEAALDAFLEADCVVATGADATVARVAARVRPPRRVVQRGHRLSVAVLGPEALHGAALRQAVECLALDVALWDQQGCLSPMALYALTADADLLEGVASALAEALAEAESRWPRGRIDAAAAASIAHERAEAELRAAAGQLVALRRGPGTSWTVVREADASLRPAPLHRFVRIHPVAEPAALLEALGPFAPHLAAVGVAGLGALREPLARGLAGLGASRVCPLGGMQAPPLGWCHDGQGVLLPLARLSDIETPDA